MRYVHLQRHSPTAQDVDQSIKPGTNSSYKPSYIPIQVEKSTAQQAPHHTLWTNHIPHNISRMRRVDKSPIEFGLFRARIRQGRLAIWVSCRLGRCDGLRSFSSRGRGDRKSVV